MKAIISILIISTILLSGCGVEFGGAYKHLQEQDPSGLHEVDVAGETNRNVNDENTEEKGVFDSLNDNLCTTKPECCGKFTDEQKDFRDLERRAIVENNKDLCSLLPNEAFIISCGNDLEEDIILYSKKRCLEEFPIN